MSFVAKNGMGLVSLLIALELASCAAPSYDKNQSPQGSQTPQQGPAQPATNTTKPATPVTPVDGNNNNVIPDPVKSTIQLTTDYDLNRPSGGQVKLSSLFTKKMLIVDFVDTNCPSCLAFSRKLLQLLQTNTINNSVCGLLIVLPNTSANPTFLADWVTGLGSNSGDYVAQISDTSVTSAMVAQSLGSTLSTTPFVAVFSGSASGGLTKVLDSDTTPVSPALFDGIQTSCR